MQGAKYFSKIDLRFCLSPASLRDRWHNYGSHQRLKANHQMAERDLTTVTEAEKVRRFVGRRMSVRRVLWELNGIDVCSDFDSSIKFRWFVRSTNVEDGKHTEFSVDDDGVVWFEIGIIKPVLVSTSDGTKVFLNEGLTVCIQTHHPHSSEFQSSMITLSLYSFLLEDLEAVPADYVPAGHSKEVGKDAKGNPLFIPPVSLDELLLYKGRIIVKARFGGNEESKKMRKTMLKQQFTKFSVTEKEGLHKVSMRNSFSWTWSQVALALKTRGGLDSMSFDDLYNKLRSLELDVRIGHSYGVKAAAAPTHSAFIGAAALLSKALLNS
ncbi:hypothetical protein Tco_1078559 [Tanacetum coccineum]|uniref:Uncharacterized protein n=1 Tax=Tanacetum coccineum TaxID=301880 RepID=A0ABQ5HQM0_9ASTR